MAGTARQLFAIAISIALMGAMVWWAVSTPRHTAPRPSAARAATATSSHAPTATASHSSTTTATAQRAPSSGRVPPPAPDMFLLVVHTGSGDLPARVAPISVASHEVVDPPHNTPEQWDTAAWVVQAAYPAAPSTGTTYVYGHACHHHVCPFTDLKNAGVGDPVVVTTRWGELKYRIDRIGPSPKSANSLPPWASDSTIKNRIVLVTCEYELGDTSVNNIVVTANLVSATPRPAS